MCKEYTSDEVAEYRENKKIEFPDIRKEMEDMNEEMGLQRDDMHWELEDREDDE